MVDSRVALQLYTVRQALDADPARTLQRVRTAGYSFVETAGIPAGLSPTEFGRQILASGLEVVSLHTMLPTVDEFESSLELANVTRCNRVIWHGWPRDPRFDTIASVHQLAEKYTQASAMAEKLNLQFGIHTHWWEFEPVDGNYPYQIFASTLSPSVFFQIDVYWLRVAGLDPTRVIDELEPRIVSLHAKDGPAVHGQPMTAIGDGVIDFPSITRAVHRPIDWVVELDECATDLFIAAKRSRTVLESLLDC